MCVQNRRKSLFVFLHENTNSIGRNRTELILELIYYGKLLTLYNIIRLYN